MNRVNTSLRQLRSNVLRAHRPGFAGVVVVAAATGCVITAGLNALGLANTIHRDSGTPYEAAQWNIFVEVMKSVNVLIVGLGAAAAAALLTSVASFALRPLIPTLARLSLVGMTRHDLLRLIVGELTRSVAGGATLGAALGIPGSLALLAGERASGVAPEELGLTLLPHAIALGWLTTVCSGLVGGILPVVRVSKTRPLDVATVARNTRRRTMWRAAISFLLLAAAIALVFLPDDLLPVDAETSVVIVVPLAATLVTLNGPLFLNLVTRSLGSIPSLQHRPQVLIALSNVRSGGYQALTATQSIVLVFSLVVPLAMVMASGRMVSEVESTRPLHSTTIVSLSSVPSPQALDSVDSHLSDGTVVPYVIVPDLLSAVDPYGAEQPSVSATTLKQLPSQLDVTFSQGTADAVHDHYVATAGERYEVGDKVDLLRHDGSMYSVTIVARIDSNAYLGDDIILDYASNADEFTNAAWARGLSSASPHDVQSAFVAAGVTVDTVQSRRSWIADRISSTVVEQRRVLVMIFAVPGFIALASTLLGVRTYSQVTARSRKQMHYLGMTTEDMTREYRDEVVVQLLVIIVELLIAIGLCYWKVTRFVRSFDADSLPILDVPVTTIATLSMFAVFVVAHAVYFNRTVRNGFRNETV